MKFSLLINMKMPVGEGLVCSIHPYSSENFVHSVHLLRNKVLGSYCASTQIEGLVHPKCPHSIEGVVHSMQLHSCEGLLHSMHPYSSKCLVHSMHSHNS